MNKYVVVWAYRYKPTEDFIFEEKEERFNSLSEAQEYAKKSEGEFLQSFSDERDQRLIKNSQFEYFADITLQDEEGDIIESF